MGRKSKHGAAMRWLQDQMSADAVSCSVWPFAVGKSGYGNIRVGNGHSNAHRVMAETAHGPAPFPKAEVAHSCGVRLCCNPHHLRWASRTENHADKVLHGTMIRGEAQHMAKLTRADVVQIMKDTRSASAIAEDYRCTPSNISRIKRGLSWAWLTRQPSTVGG